MRFAAIADWAAEKKYDVDFMCEMLEVSRSGYYTWQNRPPSDRAVEDPSLISRIKRLFTNALGNPGVRRMTAMLKADDLAIGRRRVLQLMQTAGLARRHLRARAAITVPGDQPVPAPDLLGRDLTGDQPNTRWCGDIMYVKTIDDNWCYLATVIDEQLRSSHEASVATTG